MLDVPEHNRKAWDHLVDKGDQWTRCVDEKTIASARAGNWSIVLTNLKPVPRNWFPQSLVGERILCLASGGGQQGPVLAAAGASVTVFDNSAKQLDQDRHVALRDNLDITTELGDMCDLSRFAANTFDIIVHPVANLFVESVLPLWREAARVLKPGGTLLAGFANPVLFIFDLKQMEEGKLIVRHRVPYADQNDLCEEELQSLILADTAPLCHGHSLHDQIQGQLDAGFMLAGFYEDKAGDGVLREYIDTFIATRSIKIDPAMLSTQ
ncbi:MAG: class I SAM-dependent methyltransferase [Pseudomonadota bacterium]